MNPLIRLVARELAKFVKQDRDETEESCREAYGHGAPAFLDDSLKLLQNAITVRDLIDAYHTFDSSTDDEGSYWSDNFRWYQWFNKSDIFRSLIYPRLGIDQFNYLQKGQHYKKMAEVFEEIGATMGNLDDGDIDVLGI